MDTRRDFLKKAALLTGAAMAGVPPFITASYLTIAGSDPASAADALTPRRVELLDAGWRFRHAEPIAGTPVTDWVWTAGVPDQEAAMTAPDLDTSSPAWQKTTAGDDTLPENSYGWFHTVLPDIKGPGRTVHFDCVDDNGTVYLNGRKLLTHDGWSDPFDVDLDPAWREGQPNVLVVLVQNIGGPGGITKPVTLYIRTPEPFLAGLLCDDSDWRTVHLPHDYVVEGAFDPQGDVGHGALPATPAWYRRKFHLPASDRGKSVWLYFEGVFRNATVYINGKQVYFQDDGYDPFLVDIGSAVTYGTDNLLAVHVDPMHGEGWWYEGGGIYRHVWLNVCDPVHVIPWGVYVTSRVSDPLTAPSAQLSIETQFANAGTQNRTVTVDTAIVDPNGTTVATAVSTHAAQAGSEVAVTQTAALPRAVLWSLEAPALYTAKTTLTVDGRVVDRFSQTFGVRTIRFDADHGFFLNEKALKLQGTCNHQDFVGVGIAMPDSILWWRMQRLKDALGCNSIRCSHNPMTTAMYEACDALGLLVMDETRHPGDAPDMKASIGTPFSHTEHIEKMVRRDRNHPSVIMWSMANEEWAVQGDPYGATMLRALMDAVHRHDTTRPVTTALNAGVGSGWLVGFGSVEDLLGVNYNYGDYDWLHQQYPNKPVFGSETASDESCRGVYATDPAAGHLTSYMTPENSWSPLAEREFVAGGFVWTGFDYRGEPTPYGWPEISSNFGLLDACGFPKDAAYYYKAWWKQDEPLVHIFPHWNWQGREGQTVPVWCFSNCDRVELALNGVTQGVRDMPRYGHIEWNDVVYAPGKLVATGYRNGAAVAQTAVATTGAPRAIRLSANRSRLTADGEDTVPVQVEIVDAGGLVVPTAANQIRFVVRGAGSNAGVGNGDPSSHEPNQGSTRSAFNGLCMVLIRASTAPGAIVLTASANGLSGASAKFQVVHAD